MSKFINQILKESKRYGIKLYAEAAEENNVEQETDNQQEGTENQAASEQTNTEQQAPQVEADPFPERFVYLAGLLQKALIDKFPSLMNIEPITQNNAAQVIQNMEGLMKQAGMLDDIDTTNVNI